MYNIDYLFWDKIRIIGKKIIRRKPGYKNFHTQVCSLENSCIFLREVIKSDKPFMAAKFGESELEVLRNAFAIERAQNKKSKIRIVLDYLKFGDRYEWTGLKTIVKDSGFFPSDSSLLHTFSEIYIDSIKQMDIFVTSEGLQGWYSNKGEDYILKWVRNKPKIITSDSYGVPNEFHKIWTDKLAGKKVLVIHPFESSIKKGYKNREKHFPFILLPEFELKTIKAIQSIAFSETPFKSWFEALNYMKQEIDLVDFDIALIGCGAYGVPLAAYIKEKNKQAIHIGGSLQLFFGISGNRWNKNPIVGSYYNDYWTQPSAEEIPKTCHLVGDGSKAYW